jgi:hypothetical protein
MDTRSKTKGVPQGVSTTFFVKRFPKSFLLFKELIQLFESSN